MYPTIKNGEICFLIKDFYGMEYHRGDIVYVNTDDKKVIKRIIGLPGEKVQYIDGEIYINEIKTKDDYSSLMSDPGILKEAVLLKKDEYIILGDNRNNSVDSRVFGKIKKKNIKGKIIKK